MTKQTGQTEKLLEAVNQALRSHSTSAETEAHLKRLITILEEDLAKAKAAGRN